MTVPAGQLQQVVTQALVDPVVQYRQQAAFDRNRQHAVPMDSYQTQLSGTGEAAFRQWLQHGQVPFNPNDPQADYDMRGFWQGLQAGDPHAVQAQDPNDLDEHGRPKMHFTDWWKTPYHDTFSADSQYALPTAPRWVNDNQLVDPRTNTVIYDDRPAAADYAAPPTTG
jgi:hypothetical protein